MPRIAPFANSRINLYFAEQGHAVGVRDAPPFPMSENVHAAAAVAVLDAPGVCSPNLRALPFTHARPIYPLDEVADWR